MAYNLGTVRQNVRNRLDDEDFEQEYLDRAINYAQWQITNKHHLRFMEDSEDLTVNQGSYDVPLPADYHESLYLVLTSPTAVRADLSNKFTKYRDFVATYIDPSVNTQSQPNYWSVYGSNIKLGSPADQTYTLRLDFLRKSPLLDEETDVPDIPEEFQELLELGAYIRIAKREDDYDIKIQEERDYEKLKDDLLAVYGREKMPGGLRRMGVR